MATPPTSPNFSNPNPEITLDRTPSLLNQWVMNAVTSPLQATYDPASHGGVVPNLGMNIPVGLDPSLHQAYRLFASDPSSKLWQQPGQKFMGPGGQWSEVYPYASWFDFMNQGRNAVAGINRMPFVFSNYANVSPDPATAMKQFYPNYDKEKDTKNPEVVETDPLAGFIDPRAIWPGNYTGH